MKVTTFFVNTTTLCNLDCKRCYLKEETRLDKSLLSPATLKKFLDSSYANGRVGEVIWIGGEVTTVPSEHLFALSDVVNECQPQLTQGVVSNLLGTTKGHLEFYKSRCCGHVDSTFALGAKVTKSGSTDKYLQVFAETANKITEFGLTLSINVELNPETYSLGPRAMVDYMKKIPAACWEFDHSIDFETYIKIENLSAKQVPNVKPSISYEMFWSYMQELYNSYEEIKACGHVVGFFDKEIRNSSNFFSADKTDAFWTLNVNGTVTTNPLYSDFEGAMCGHVDDPDSIANSEFRLLHIKNDIERQRSCYSCEHRGRCSGGTSSLPVEDGSGACNGGRKFRSYLDSRQM